MGAIAVAVPDPEAARAWGRIFRDFAIVFVGVFILIHETISGSSPDPLLIGAGLVALGLPPALRADEWLRRRGDDVDPGQR